MADWGLSTIVGRVEKILYTFDLRRTKTPEYEQIRLPSTSGYENSRLIQYEGLFDPVLLKMEYLSK